MKNKIPKTIFILLFIPYIYILSSTLFGKYILNDVELKGIERLMKNIVSNYQYYVYEIPIIPTCLTFQTCYLFRKKPKFMFMYSFIPCIFILLLGFQYAIWGGRFLGDTLYYGLEGFNLGIFFGFIYYTLKLPLIPACLIFQIICGIVKIKKRRNNINKD